jgi:hypothetical protein
MALPGLNALTEILHETNRLLASVLTELEQTNNVRLDETNRLLASVLAQLEQTNGVRLEAMSAELRDLNQRLGGAAPGD